MTAARSQGCATRRSQSFTGEAPARALLGSFLERALVDPDDLPQVAVGVVEAPAVHDAVVHWLVCTRGTGGEGGIRQLVDLFAEPSAVKNATARSRSWTARLTKILRDVAPAMESSLFVRRLAPWITSWCDIQMTCLYPCVRASERARRWTQVVGNIGHIRDAEDAASRRSQPRRHHRYFDVAPLGAQPARPRLLSLPYNSRHARTNETTHNNPRR